MPDSSMHSTTLIIPGLHGSGPGHWQTWFEQRIPGAIRVEQADWDAPVLGVWASAVRRAIDRATGSVWIVAHSFGCLAAVAAAQDRAERIAGALLVAPADPESFPADGARADDFGPAGGGIGAMLPRVPLGFPSVIVASHDDPWLRITRAAYWAQRWGSRLVGAGNAGHVNVDSGFGPWPDGLALFHAMRGAQDGVPLGPIELRGKGSGRGPRGRRSLHPAMRETE